MLRALDLYCGAGGAARGLQNAGFRVYGIDIVFQPRYAGNGFVQRDVKSIGIDLLRQFDFIWASPPCQRFTILQNARQRAHMHPDLIGFTRQLLRNSGKLFCIENVPGAPLVSPKMLCGLALGLAVKRHRIFETNFFFSTPPCPKQHDAYDYWVIAGHEARLSGRMRRRNNFKGAKAAMGCEWMNQDELREAIPPRYAEFIGKAAMGIING